MAMTPAQVKQYKEVYATTRNDVRAFAKLVNFQPVGGQREFCDTVEALTLNEDMMPKQIGVKAGTDTGKTKNLAFLTLWRTWRSPGTLSVSTAPTERQCKEVFFRELAQIVSGSQLLSEMMEVTDGKAHFIGHSRWRIISATANDENNMRGFHDPHLTIAAEELTGIAPPVLDALLRTLSQKDNLFMGIFNPDKIVGLAYEMFTSKKEFWPWNLTINKIQIAQERPDLVDPRRIEIWRKEYGEDSDFWRVGVLGEFPLSTQKGIITQQMINKAVATPIWVAIAGDPTMTHSRVISVDYARFGGDETVIYARCGNAIVHCEVLTCEPRDASLLAMQIQDRLGWTNDDTQYVIDKVGMGQSQLVYFYDADKNVDGFSPVQKSPVEGYKDRLTASWFNLRKRMMYGKVYLPDDEILHEQLRTREYKYMGGDLVTESKKEYKKRGFKKSPDRADALAMAFSTEEEIRESLSEKIDWGLDQDEETPMRNKLIY